jgi:hypothetical protein
MRGVGWIGAGNWRAKSRSAIWSYHSTRSSWPCAARRAPADGSRQRLSLGGAGFVKVDAWRCMDRSRIIGEQISGQLFGASAPLAPSVLACPAGPRLAGSRQRHSLGGAGFVKADAWRCMDFSCGVGEANIWSTIWSQRASISPPGLAAPWGGEPGALQLPLAHGRGGTRGRGRGGRPGHLRGIIKSCIISEAADTRYFVITLTSLVRTPFSSHPFIIPSTRASSCVQSGAAKDIFS